MDSDRSSPASTRQHGSLLFELLAAITLMTLGVLGFVESFFTQYRSVQTIEEIDAASAALGTVAERISATDLSDAYVTHHGTLVPVDGLQSPDGQTAVVRVTCHVDETRIPAAFGPVEDLDGKPLSQSSDTSTTYEILPVQLSLTYETTHGNETREVFFILYAD